jgi:oxygen-independent coproporphyrinogen-3 oxidase
MRCDGDVGVYVHVPFCERVCPYCDFAVVAARTLTPAEEAGYVDALLAELDARAAAFAGLRLATLYLGGGTPALLAPASIARIVDAVRGRFAGEPAEVTLEANPSTLERARLPGFRAAGATRLSLGVQSFDDATLKRLGRAHRAGESHAAIEAARAAGFANLSLDLLFAAPGQTLAMLGRDVDAALAHAPEHLSTYALTIEEGTPFARGRARGRIAAADEELVADMMELLAERLPAAGLARYEVSSWARAGAEAQHNQRYWRRAPVLGLGVGAHSTEPPSAAAPFGARSANERALARYLARVRRGDFEPPEREALPEATARGEAAFLALRTRAGLVASSFAEEFGAPPRAFFAAAIEALRAAGLVEESARGDLALAPRGWLLADEVAARFVGS